MQSTNIKRFKSLTRDGKVIHIYSRQVAESECRNHQCIGLWLSKWKHCMSLDYLRHFVLNFSFHLSFPFSISFLFAIIPEIRLGRKQCLHILRLMSRFQRWTVPIKITCVDFRDARKHYLVQRDSSIEDLTGGRGGNIKQETTISSMTPYYALLWVLLHWTWH